MSALRVLPLLALTVATACNVRSLEVTPLPAHSPPTRVSTPVRAHLLDGSVVVYRAGATFDGAAVLGRGVRYDPLMRDGTITDRLLIDSIVGLETVSAETQMLSSTVGTVLGVAVGGLLASAAAVAAFGSCPTVYALDAEGAVLEAELFSYSIAPLLEARDVDRLGAEPVDGVLVLEIRNEALETHRINYLGALVVQHDADELVFPDASGHVVALRDLQEPTRAVDASGRDISAILAATDSLHYASPSRMLAAASVDAITDHIDLTLPPMPGRDSIAIVLRLRNSLLNTVLFYDEMLGAAGAHALDWMGASLERIGPAVELGQWYVGRMGLWVHTEGQGDATSTQRVPDAGPIAWKDVAVVVPASGADSIRIRLEFVIDEWRIDRVRIAERVRRPEVREVPVAEIALRSGTRLEDAARRVAAPDEDYLETLPSNVFHARFDVGRSDRPRTFLIASQGYYTEWIRPAWIHDAHSPRTFEPSDASLVSALRRWEAVKPDFERRFYESRIPVR